MGGVGATGRAPVRLDDQLIRDLPKGPEFEALVTMIHDLSDFFLQAAADSFSVPSPAELQTRGLSGIAPARSKLLFFNRILCLRTAELLPDAIRAINESRLISFALATRGVLETAAVAAYHAQCLAVEEGATALPSDYDDRLSAAVLAGRFDWRRLFADTAAYQSHIAAYDADPDKQQPADAAMNIVTMLDKLGRKLGTTIPMARGRIRFDYALLSDMCHPSAGSNLIFLAETSPRMRAESMPQRVTLLGISTMILPCLAYSGQSIVDALAELEQLEQRMASMGTSPAEPPSAESTGA